MDGLKTATFKKKNIEIITKILSYRLWQYQVCLTIVVFELLTDKIDLVLRFSILTLFPYSFFQFKLSKLKKTEIVAVLTRYLASKQDKLVVFIQILNEIRSEM